MDFDLWMCATGFGGAIAGRSRFGGCRLEGCGFGVCSLVAEGSASSWVYFLILEWVEVYVKHANILAGVRNALRSGLPAAPPFPGN